MEFKACTKALVCLCSGSSPTGHSTSGNEFAYLRGYDAGKSFIWGSTEEQKKASFFARFLFAQFVTSTSETLAYPLDTIRRRLMMESGKSLAERQYSGTMDCGQKILAQEGFTGFFKGNLSNFWRSIGSSLVLVLYDELQKLLQKLLKLP